MPLTTKTKTFQRLLADWYVTAQRPLPWRTKPSIYRTVVSELMAQQTQIKTMLPYFERWMQRFPDFKALADASSEDVLKHWEGLGYYSRARNLHKLAKEYISLETKPRSAAEWQTLPGIGPYTSAAISSIAQGQPAAVVDGNVVRILARLTNDQRSFKSNGDAVKAFTSLADQVLNREQPGEHNQAMMELGATICLKHNPLCTTCPVVEFCKGAASGSPESIPKIQRKAAVKVEVDRFWITDQNKVLLHQNPLDSKQLAGQYELPNHEHLGLPRPADKPLMTKMRSITHHRIKERIHLIHANTVLIKHIEQAPTLFWVPEDALQNITLSGPHRRWLPEIVIKASSSTT